MKGNLKKIKESVSAILIVKNEVFVTKRPAHMPVFPGYFATPGGKVDAEDSQKGPLPAMFQVAENHIMWAIIRELKEELGFDVLSFYEQGKLKAVSFYGEAVTPEFNPYRFKNTYIRFELLEKPEFILAKDEIEEGIWSTAEKFIADFNQGNILAVPPAMRILEQIKNDFSFKGPVEFKELTDDEFVYTIESLKGIKQFLPLSNTFPPANRTNSFLIGDDDAVKILIDPSPKPSEFEKYFKTISQYKIDAILITHHHPDHYECLDQLIDRTSLPIFMSKITFDRISRKKGDDYLKKMQIKFLKEGDIVTTYLGSPVEVLEVPGHDDGQIALRPKSNKWFLVGDLIQTIGTVVIGDDEGNMSEYFKSLNRVIDLKPNVILPSHGIIIGGVHRLEETLKHRQMREDQILHLITKEGKNFEQILDVVYEGLDERLIPYAKKTLKCHIDKLVKDKKIS